MGSGGRRGSVLRKVRAEGGGSGDFEEETRQADITQAREVGRGDVWGRTCRATARAERSRRCGMSGILSIAAAEESVKAMGADMTEPRRQSKGESVRGLPAHSFPGRA